MISADYVKTILDYDAISGRLFWKEKIADKVVVGEEAGTSSHGYKSVRINGKLYPAHRLIFAWMTGRWPKRHIDHINRNRSDNRWSNLRECTPHDNQGNRAVRKDSSSGLKGVKKNRNGRTFSARIVVNYKEVYLGNFRTKEAAHAAYMEAAEYHFGEFASAT